MNNSNPKVSVIIPVFNVEKYIRVCLNSVLGQNLVDIEVIAIDDKSTDNSLNILMEYQKKDPRLRIFKNKENMGPSYNRNLGINQAKGEYIQFVDADDWLEPNALKTLYNEAKFPDLDILIFPFSLYHEDTGEFEDSEYSSLGVIDDSFNNTIFDYRSFKGDTLFNIPFTPINKIYKSSFLKSFTEPFYEGVDVAADPLFFYTVLLNAKRVSINRDFLYNYRMYEGSLSTKDDRRSFDSLFIMGYLIELVKKIGIYESIKNDLIHFVNNIFKTNYYRLNDAFKEEFINSLKEEYEIWENDSIDYSYWPNGDKAFYLAVQDASDIKEFELNSKIYYYKFLSTDYKTQLDYLRSENKILLNDYNKLSDENLNLRIHIEDLENSGVNKIKGVFKK